MSGTIQQWLCGAAAAETATAGYRPRLFLENRPEVVYAIGDVHGCYAGLIKLERMVVEDARAVEGEKLIVMLGDYVDRGPQSAQALEHLLQPPPEGFGRICLAGNHEEVMLDFLRHPDMTSPWFGFGGLETLLSYGFPVDALIANEMGRAELEAQLRACVPKRHMEVLAGLPACLRMPGVLFTHAGIRPGIPLHEQSERDLMWIRHEFLDREHGQEDLGSGPVKFALTMEAQMAKWQEESAERTGSTVKLSDAPVGHLRPTPKGRAGFGHPVRQSTCPYPRYVQRAFPAGLAKSGSVVSVNLTGPDPSCRSRTHAITQPAASILPHQCRYRRVRDLSDYGRQDYPKRRGQLLAGRILGLSRPGLSANL